MTITSRQNPLIKDCRKWVTDGAFRRKTGRFVAEGARLCADAALSGVVIETALFTAAAAEQYAEYLETILPRARQAVEISDSVAAYISDTSTPQGIFCVCERPAAPPGYGGFYKNGLDNTQMLGTIKKDSHYLALEEVRDPGNLGTIIRTAEALGMDGLLVGEGCCDLYRPKVLRGSMGGVFRLPVWEVGPMAEVIQALEQGGIPCYACVVSPKATSLLEVDLARGGVAVIGNEANGLKPETIAACGMQVTIPMAGRAESLNASMAAGIVMWEMTRAAAQNE